LCFSFPCHAQAPWNKSTSYDRSDVDSDSSKNVSPWERPASPPQQVQQYRYEVKHPTASKAILLDSPEIRQSNPAEIRYLGNGTEVEVLATVPDQKIPALSWYRVLVKNGNMRGSVGYISATNIRLMGGPSPSGSQRGGQFSTNSADERIGGTSQASTTNKTGYTMKNSALLLSEPDISKSTQKEFQVGTAVTGTRLELLGVIPDPNITPMKWFYVRMLDGQLAGITGYVSASNVREDGGRGTSENLKSRSLALTEARDTNRKEEEYVMKTGALIVAEPNFSNVSDKSNQIGFAVAGTRVQVLDEPPAIDGPMRWRSIRVVSGDMIGKNGWVSAAAIEESKCNKMGPISRPEGFRTVSEGYGFCGYQQVNSSSQTHVIVADLDQAYLQPICGEKTDSGITRHRLFHYWGNGLNRDNSQYRLKAAVNGTWFRSGSLMSTPGSSLGLKCNGRVYDYGDRSATSLWNNVQLLVWRPSLRRIDITLNEPLLFSANENSDVAGIYAENTPIRNARGIDGRTIVGLAGCEGVRGCRYLLIYSSLGATLPEAIQNSRSFGVAKVGLLDGGWSTGIIIDGRSSIMPLISSWLPDQRWIPHAYLIYEGGERPGNNDSR